MACEPVQGGGHGPLRLPVPPPLASMALRLSAAAPAESPALAAAAGMSAGSRPTPTPPRPLAAGPGPIPGFEPAEAAGIRLVALGGDPAAAMLKLVAVVVVFRLVAKLGGLFQRQRLRVEFRGLQRRLPDVERLQVGVRGGVDLGVLERRRPLGIGRFSHPLAHRQHHQRNRAAQQGVEHNAAKQPGPLIDEIDPNARFATTRENAGESREDRRPIGAWGRLWAVGLPAASLAISVPRGWGPLLIRNIFSFGRRKTSALSAEEFLRIQ